MAFKTDAAYAHELDQADELAHFREEFVIDDPDLIYLDGNSLGRLPKRTVQQLEDVIQSEWGGRLIRGWNQGWFTTPQRIGSKIAQLVGAHPEEVIVADSTSVNLFKLVIAALGAKPGRTKLLTDDLNFPSDLYVVQGALRLAGPQYRLQVIHSEDGIGVDEQLLAQAIDGETALVVLTHTAFKSGYVYDMNSVTAKAHQFGAFMLWDLCHSVGAMPLGLDAANVDLAVGCTYKHLNGGPGSPAFLFVRRDLQEELSNPIWGWFGQRNPFEFALTYEPAEGILHFLSGTPPILSLSAIEPSLDLLVEAGMDRIRAKSMRQSEYLVGLWEELLQPLGVRMNSPRDVHRRGSHVSLGHPEGLRIDHALIEEMKVIPDFRAPDNIRLGIAPLYTTFSEIHEAVMRLRHVLVTRIYEKYSVEGAEVT